MRTRPEPHRYEAARDHQRAANNRIRGMKLLPKAIRRRLPALYGQHDKAGQAVAYLKLFTPDANWTWWATEGSPIRDQTGREIDFRFFGLVDGQCKELGYFTLSELETVRGPLGLPVERDLHWQPKRLAEIAPELFESSEFLRAVGQKGGDHDRSSVL